MQMFNPAHPGEVLKEAYLEPLGLSVSEFARRIGVSRKSASELVNKRSGVSVEMACRLAKSTNTSAEFWLNMQVQYALWEAQTNKLSDQLQVESLLPHAA